MAVVNEDVARLVSLLACPLCRGMLEARHGVDTVCLECGTDFSSRDGVPVLVPKRDGDERMSIPARLQYAVLGNPRVYDFQQSHFGAQPVVDRLRGVLTGVETETVLDIGAGTGVIAGLLPPTSEYIWLDNDALKLKGFLSKATGGFAVMGDGARLPLRPLVADLSLLVEVSHHLTDDAFENCVAEAARVTRGKLVFVDAVWGRRLRSKLMWQLDLGRHPRPERAVLDVLETAFDVTSVDRFGGVNHDHVMCLCSPKESRHDAVGLR